MLSSENTSLTDLQYPLVMSAGASFKRGFRFKDSDDNVIDLTGYHAAIEIRAYAGAMGRNLKNLGYKNGVNY